MVSLVCVYLNPTNTPGFADDDWYPHVPVSLEEMNDAIFDYKSHRLLQQRKFNERLRQYYTSYVRRGFSDSEEEDFEYYTGMFKLSINSYLFEHHSFETSKKAELPFGSFSYNEEIEESQDDGFISYNYHVTAWGVWKTGCWSSSSSVSQSTKTIAIRHI